jgi:anti-anti-sigma factor
VERAATVSGQPESGPETIVLDVHGALDMTSAPELCREIDAAAADERCIVLDLSSVDHCDPNAVRALVGAAREATIRMRQVVVAVTAGTTLDRLITLAGAREFLRVEDDIRRVPMTASARRRQVSIGE